VGGIRYGKKKISFQSGYKTYLIFTESDLQTVAAAKANVALSVVDDGDELQMNG